MPRDDAGAGKDLPAEVERALGQLVSAAREALATDLISIVLFGSAAEAAPVVVQVWSKIAELTSRKDQSTSRPG